jgi:hypothetical protein
VELPLLQRFLFELFLRADLMLAGEVVEPRFTGVVFFGPLAELGILVLENALNVRGTIRHRLSSFEVPSSR